MNKILRAKEDARKISKSKKLKLKEALLLIAKEKSFPDWKSYKDSIDTYWYQKSSPFLNHWFSKHSEANEYKEKSGGYLLTFKGQYFVTSREYIEHIGIDPDDKVWPAIKYDVSTSTALEKFYNYYKGMLKDNN